MEKKEKDDWKHRLWSASVVANTASAKEILAGMISPLDPKEARERSEMLGKCLLSVLKTMRKTTGEKERACFEMAELLLAHGASPNFSSVFHMKRQRPLILVSETPEEAWSEWKRKTLVLLLEAGADPSLPGETRTALGRPGTREAALILLRRTDAARKRKNVAAGRRHVLRIYPELAAIIEAEREEAAFAKIVEDNAKSLGGEDARSASRFRRI